MYKIYTDDEEPQVLTTQQINILSGHSKYLQVVLDSISEDEEVKINVGIAELELIIQLLEELQKKINRNKVIKEEYNSLGIILDSFEEDITKQETIDLILLKKIDEFMKNEPNASKQLVRLTQLAIVAEYLDIEYLHQLLCLKIANLIDTSNIEELRDQTINAHQN